MTPTQPRPQAAAWREFLQADATWQAELRAVLGPEHFPALGHLKVYQRGPEGSDLRRLFDARTAAHSRWLATRGCVPAHSH